jgi:hypothetical protein
MVSIELCDGTTLTAGQRRALDRLIALLRADGFTGARVVVRNAREELREFGPAGAAALVPEDAIVVLRDPAVSWEFDGGVGEHVIPGEGLILDGSGRIVDIDDDEGEE